MISARRRYSRSRASEPGHRARPSRAAQDRQAQEPVRQRSSPSPRKSLEKRRPTPSVVALLRRRGRHGGQRGESEAEEKGTRRIGR